ncbi:MAG: MerR family transcriptional regulator [Gammaproteobacteria bacterium]
MPSPLDAQIGSNAHAIEWQGSGQVPDPVNYRSGAASSRATYKIGAVSRLTGITTHTLRKWENRYAMVVPERTAGGDRLYARSDVRKLLLVKDLIQAGMALAKVAGMSVKDLERANDEVFAQAPGCVVAERIAASDTHAPKVANKITVTIVGSTLPRTLEAGLGLLNHFDLRRTSGAAADLLAAESCPATDGVVWECPHLQLEDREILLAMMARSQAVCAIVVFGFGARDHVSAMRARNVSLLRGPLDADEIQRVALGMMYDLRWH